jgi:DNA-binding MurR/RpiR family transcriptional regulator
MRSTLTVSEMELRELVAVLRFAAEQKFYGIGESEPWNQNEKLAFERVKERAEAMAKEQGVIQ